ncbi:hypothetical protein QJS10_CPB21g01549 [Acorus calamus]|uniref:Uncharacterized protein n=1 Tax=Acorus calamus TaxID=4465 RepID=A0AAV9C7B3_ACOCL|nr:hypothetical protein QJS10_CPB21g01549 [Acorus calamus]
MGSGNEAGVDDDVRGHRVLSTIHAGIEVLFSDLSVSNIESIFPSYLDESVKLLHIYNRHRLLIWLVIHLLSSSSGAGEIGSPIDGSEQWAG